MEVSNTEIDQRKPPLGLCRVLVGCSVSVILFLNPGNYNDCLTHDESCLSVLGLRMGFIAQSPGECGGPGHSSTSH